MKDKTCVLYFLLTIISMFSIMFPVKLYKWLTSMNVNIKYLADLWYLKCQLVLKYIFFVIVLVALDKNVSDPNCTALYNSTVDTSLPDSTSINIYPTSYK